LHQDDEVIDIVQREGASAAASATLPIPEPKPPPQPNRKKVFARNTHSETAPA